MSLYMESIEAAWCPDDLQPRADMSFTLIKQTGEGWDFTQGECERGAACRFLHVGHAADGGVVHDVCFWGWVGGEGDRGGDWVVLHVMRRPFPSFHV